VRVRVLSPALLHAAGTTAHTFRANIGRAVGVRGDGGQVANSAPLLTPS
jgi:hypothetical protein